MTVSLEFCSRTDDRYVEMRDRHYIPNKGAHGQQIHFIVWDDDVRAGIISGGSSVYAVKARDEFFGIPSNKEERESLWLPSIVNNTVFRLETTRPNLGTETLRRWRSVTRELWPQLYGVPVIGFETFIIEESFRRGAMYKADNWQLVGETAGNTKQHVAGEGGLTGKHSRATVEPKLILCRWAKKRHTPKVPYVSSWKASTQEEKDRAKKIASFRKSLLGERF